jgi:uncharacterized protein with HEPN domain
MAKHPVLLCLEDMRIEIERLNQLAARTSFEAFASDWLLQHAAERAIEKISEASRHIPDSLKSQVKDIAWRNIAGIGNILRHDYDRVDPARIWSVLIDELGPLQQAVLTMIEVAQRSEDRR